MDQFYDQFINMSEPKHLICECGWTGNKPKIIKFKKKEIKNCCPDCGNQVFENAVYTFWKTANKFSVSL